MSRKRTFQSDVHFKVAYVFLNSSQNSVKILIFSNIFDFPVNSVKRISSRAAEVGSYGCGKLNRMVPPDLLKILT